MLQRVDFRLERFQFGFVRRVRAAGRNERKGRNSCCQGSIVHGDVRCQALQRQGVSTSQGRALGNVKSESGTRLCPPRASSGGRSMAARAPRQWNETGRSAVAGASGVWARRATEAGAARDATDPPSARPADARAWQIWQTSPLGECVAASLTTDVDEAGTPSDGPTPSSLQCQWVSVRKI